MGATTVNIVEPTHDNLRLFEVTENRPWPNISTLPEVCLNCGMSFTVIPIFVSNPLCYMFEHLTSRYINCF